jgi:hypothetical protein
MSEEGVSWEQACAYANGLVLRPREHQSTFLTAEQQLRRDALADRRGREIAEGARLLPPARAAERIKTMHNEVWRPAHRTPEVGSRPSSDTCLQVGSQGTSVYAELTPYDPTVHMAYGLYHLLYLGTLKDYLRWLSARLDAPRPGGMPPLANAAVLKGLIACRLSHVILRSSTTCGVCNFVDLLGAMTIAEMQLLYEVVLPYLVHDWRALAVPPEVVLMGCGARSP